MQAIKIEQLRKEYEGGVVAVCGIDLEVEDGQVFAFLGPNGAGKTTTVRMLTTLLRPTSGRATVASSQTTPQTPASGSATRLAFAEPSRPRLLKARRWPARRARPRGTAAGTRASMRSGCMFEP